MSIKSPVRSVSYCVLAVMAASLASDARGQTKTSELRGGRWVDTSIPTTQVAADRELDRIEPMVRRGQNTAARKALVRWFKSRRKDAPLRDRAIYLMGVALYQYGDRLRSFYYFDQLMDEYPESPLYYAALEKQFQIADAYLDGYKNRFLGFPMFGAAEDGVEMLYRIQQRSPGSPLAEKALLRSADYYYFDGQYDLAADAYGFYMRQYPRSPAVPQAKLRQAFSNYAQFRGLRFDATPLVDARAQLVDVIASYPDLAREERIATFVERIDQTFAAKLYVTADFYRRTDEPRAAVYLYRFLIDAYPDSTEAQRARHWLSRMPSWALSTQSPGAADVQTPASNGPAEAR